METDYNNVKNLKNETPKNAREGLHRLKETWMQFEAHSKLLIIAFTLIAAFAFAFSFSMKKSFRPAIVQNYDILNSVTDKIDSVIIENNRDSLLYVALKRIIIELEASPLNDSLLKKDTLYDKLNYFKAIKSASSKDLKRKDVITSYNQLKNQLKVVIAERKPNETLTKILFFITRILFYCFAGVAFIFIGKNNNKLIKSGDVKIVKTDYRANKKYQKEYDKSNLYLSLALLIWVFADTVNLIRIYSFDLPVSISNDVFNLYAAFVISLLSTLNSYCFLHAAFGFDFYDPPWWQSRKLYYDFFGDKRIINIITVCIIVFETTFFIFSFIHKQNSQGFSWTDIPDFAFSMLALIVMALHLLYAFNERKNPEFNVFVVITMALVFYAQCFVLLPKNSVLMPGFTAKLTILGLYPILLIILFLSLAESWVDFFKGIRLESEKKEIENLRRSMHHRMKNYLGRISYYTGSFVDDNDVLNDKLALTVAKHIKSRVAVYQDLTSLVYDVEKLGDKVINNTNLYGFITDLVMNYKELFTFDNFIAEIDKDSIQRFDHPEIQVDQAQYLGEYLTELVLNAQKYAVKEEDAWVKIEAKNINNALYIRVLDKNAAFGEKFEEAIGEHGRGGLRALYKKVKYDWNAQIKYGRVIELQANYIELVIPIEQLK